MHAHPYVDVGVVFFSPRRCLCRNGACLHRCNTDEETWMPWRVEVELRGREHPRAPNMLISIAHKPEMREHVSFSLSPDGHVETCKRFASTHHGVNDHVVSRVKHRFAEVFAVCAKVMTLLFGLMLMFAHRFGKATGDLCGQDDAEFHRSCVEVLVGKFGHSLRTKGRRTVPEWRPICPTCTAKSLETQMLHWKCREIEG